MGLGFVVLQQRDNLWGIGVIHFDGFLLVFHDDSLDFLDHFDDLGLGLVVHLHSLGFVLVECSNGFHFVFVHHLDGSGFQFVELLDGDGFVLVEQSFVFLDGGDDLWLVGGDDLLNLSLDVGNDWFHSLLDSLNHFVGNFLVVGLKVGDLGLDLLDQFLCVNNGVLDEVLDVNNLGLVNKVKSSFVSLVGEDDGLFLHGNQVGNSDLLDLNSLNLQLLNLLVDEFLQNLNLFLNINVLQILDQFLNLDFHLGGLDLHV